jgi:hypothetical protein
MSISPLSLWLFRSAVVLVDLFFSRSLLSPSSPPQPPFSQAAECKSLSLCKSPRDAMDSAALPLGDWDHSLFGELQHLLARINSQPTTSTLRRLYAQLDEAKPWLLGLTHLPGPSDLDKQVVETRELSIVSRCR